MYKIILSCPLVAHTGFDKNDSFIKVEPDILQKIDGYEENELKVFNETLCDHMVLNGQTLSTIKPSIVQKIPDIILKINKDSKDITAESVFLSPKEFSQKELEKLAKEYTAQMSDGLGSIMCQKLEKEYKIHFDFYFLYSDDKKKEASITQVKSENDEPLYKELLKNTKEQIKPVKEASIEFKDSSTENKNLTNTLIALLKALAFGILVYFIVNWLMKNIT